jgi:GTPase
MIDLVKLHLIAGNGGDGRISFRRAKYIPKGGPDGGNGGAGGNIILRGTKRLTSLQDLTGLKEIKAEPGQNGGKQKRMGAKGADVVIEVPVGTIVWLLAENETSQRRHQRYGVSYLMGRDEINLEIYEVPEGEGMPPRDYDDVEPILQEEAVLALDDQDEDTAAILKREARLLKKTIASSSDRLAETDFRHLPKQQLVEITEDGQEVIIAQGGFGGHGNTSFKGPSRTTPRLAEFGSYGEHKVVVLEQRLLADIGLVGFPSVGKSTLLSVLTEARPKIAAYPFTTLEPQLGVMTANDREMVIADLPGLIEGAHEGKGLGYAFLRHVEHCKTLLVVLALEESIVFDEQLTVKEKVKHLTLQLKELQRELNQYSQLLLEKKQLLGVSKADLYDQELQAGILKAFGKQQPILFSAATGAGIAELKQLLTQE